MLKQRCNDLTIANCGKRIVTFLLYVFVDFNWLLLSEIILVGALRTSYNILLSFVGFVEYLGSGMSFITIHCMLCLLKYITENSPNHGSSKKKEKQP